MKSKTYHPPRRSVQIVANAGIAVSALWLLTYLVPAGRTLMLDKAFAYLLSLMVTGLLWWVTYQESYPRRFWGLLAWAWTAGLLASTALGVYELLTGEPLPYFSLPAILYLARYLLIFLAFWRYLGVPAGRQWLRLALLLLVAAAVVLSFFYLCVPVPRQTVYWLAGALYPILDVGLLCPVLAAWQKELDGALRNALGLLALALFAYGAANWLIFFGRAMPLDTVSGVAGLFWPLADILTGAGLLHLLWMTSTPTLEQNVADS